MKKILFITLSLITVLIISILILWFFRISIINYFLTKDFGTAVEIQKIGFAKNKLSVEGFKIKNPPLSHSEIAGYTKDIVFETTWKKLRDDTLTIEKIQANDILIVIEFFNNKGDKNNWAEILSHNGNDLKKGKPYLIKTLVLTNLKVRLIQSNGKIKDYPIIKELIFHNISDETGFPIDEIEKAIFQAVIKSVFQKIGLKNLIKTLYPPNLFKTILPFF